MPDWLREIAPPEGALPQAAPSVSPFTEVPFPVPVTPTTPALEAPPFAAAQRPEIEGIGELARAEIPDWLQAMRPRETPVAAIEEEVVETTGLLEGLRNVLAPIAEVPHVREPAPPMEASAASLARAQLFQSLLTQPLEAPRPEAPRRSVSVAEQVLHALVKVFLAIAVAGMLLAQHLQEKYGVSIKIPPLAHPRTPSAVEGLHNAIQDISAGTPVLIAFEYGPVESDELDVIAQPILAHLLAQQAHIMVAATQPEGLAMAGGLVNVAPEDSYYRPGGATGVAQMLQAVEARTGARPGLILVLTAQPTPLRWWIEQTRALYADATPPIIAGLSASLEPIASPYLDAGQLDGTVSGLSGATTYETARGTQGEASRRFSALAAGHAVVIALMLAGAIIYALARPRRREQ